MIEDLRVVAEQQDGGERAWALLARTYGAAATCLHRMGSPLAATAGERAAAAARGSGDPLLAAAFEVEQGTYLMHRGLYAPAVRLAVRSRSLIEDQPRSVDTFSVLGRCHLSAAIAAARGGDSQTSDAHLSEAHDLARFVPDGTDRYDTAFSPSNVIMHSVAAAVEQGDGTAALERYKPIGVAMPSRVAHHHVDTARAGLLHGDHERTVSELLAAKAAAPQLTRYHPQVPETLRVLAEQQRRRSDTVSGLARWAGVRV